jgi:putative SOS response-associated peptidase YedK
MCGRYVTPGLSGIEPLFDLDAIADDLPAPTFNARPTFGIRPGDRQPPVPVVLETEREAKRTRRLVAAGWPFIPAWSRTRVLRASRFNARSEGIASKPMWQDAVVDRRALFPAVGYFETQGSGGDGHRYYFHAEDGILALGGVWSWWRGSPSAPWELTAAIVTVAAPDGAAAVHDRAPLVLPPDSWDAWLDAETAGTQHFVDGMATLAQREVARLPFHEVARLDEDSPRMIARLS